MKPEKMRILGIICAVIAGASYIMGIGAWFSMVVRSTNSGETHSSFVLFALCCVLASVFVCVAIPLLIVSGIRIRRQRNAEQKEQNKVNAYAYCPYCGTPLAEGSAFCSTCGKGL